MMGEAGGHLQTFKHVLSTPHLGGQLCYSIHLLNTRTFELSNCT